MGFKTRIFTGLLFYLRLFIEADRLLTYVQIIYQFFILVTLGYLERKLNTNLNLEAWKILFVNATFNITVLNHNQCVYLQPVYYIFN